MSRVVAVVYLSRVQRGKEKSRKQSSVPARRESAAQREAKRSSAPRHRHLVIPRGALHLQTRPRPRHPHRRRYSTILVVNNAKRPADKLVLQNASLRNGNVRPVIGHNNDRTPQLHPLTEIHITRNGQVVQLDNVRDGLEPLLVVGHLLEGVSQLDYGGLAEQTLGGHDECSVFEGVEV